MLLVSGPLMEVVFPALPIQSEFRNVTISSNIAHYGAQAYGGGILLF